MTIVFASSRVNQREQSYDDVLGVSYEFPNQYLNRVAEGDVFVYYRGTKSGKQEAGYFGTGVVGEISDSDTAGRKVCRVYNVDLFPDLVPLRDPETNEYLELVGPNRVFLQQGVRSLPDSTLQRILHIATTSEPSGSADASSDSGAGARATPGADGATQPHHRYANPEQRDASERYAVDLVLRLLREEFPGASVEEQAHNNPGFDVLVDGDTPLRYVEVKGTVGATPGFFFSEGQRRFSVNNGSGYRLYVVYAIDQAAGTHQFLLHNGPVGDSDFDLRPDHYYVIAR